MSRKQTILSLFICCCAACGAESGSGPSTSSDARDATSEDTRSVPDEDVRLLDNGSEPDSLADVPTTTDMADMRLEDGSTDMPSSDASDTSAQDSTHLSDALPDLAVDTTNADMTAADTVPDLQAADIALTDVPENIAPYALLSLNLHCLRTDGTSFGTNQARMEAVAEVAVLQGVQVIALQEVCETPSESALDILEAALEAETGQGWDSAWAFAHVAWEGTLDEADEGVGLLVQGQLADIETIDHAEQGTLRRVALGATLPQELGGLRVYSVHLDHEGAGVRHRQARETAAFGLTQADPSLDVIIAGDFNATELSPTHEGLRTFGYRDLTDPLDQGRIDHIFLHRGADFAAAETELLFDGGETPVVSDHPGVLVRLESSIGEAVVTTRILAEVDVGFGHYLSIRGDALPLDWELGWPLLNLASDNWALVLTELPASPFELKLLRDDITWMTGENATGEGGTDVLETPVF